ncbi:MAG: NAD(P)/FAD-dependent oxidoreductase [Chitinispirillales bacterium]|jgi:digeranylgeranylglycerophospholipid reductase|nr:NAD(P)/FAD-dependent oxidoreductase [Chitinispirillales bacterium]
MYSIDKNYDIIVAGSGPAGACAAMSAASGGRRVLLLERKPVPGVPVRCGEGIGHQGLALSFEPRPEWIKSTVTRARMLSPSGIGVEIGNVGKSYILDRERMDADLVKMAVEAGAEFRASSPAVWAGETSSGRYSVICSNNPNSPTEGQTEFEASCLILADGVESRLARYFGWDTALRLEDIETAAFARVEAAGIEGDCCTFYTGNSVAPGGYLWVFPRGAGAANVGLGVIGSRCRSGLPRKLLLDFIKRTYPGGRVTDLHCGGVPVAKWVRPLVRGAVMLVGDAARQVNAINGAGLAYSLYAGRLAGTVAAGAFRGDGNLCRKALLGYQREWAKVFGKQQERSFALKEFIMSADDAFLDRIADSLSKEPPGKLSYLRVFMRTFSSRPLLLLKAFKLFR